MLRVILGGFALRGLLLTGLLGAPFFSAFAQSLDPAREARFYDSEFRLADRQAWAREWWQQVIRTKSSLKDALEILDRLRAARVLTNSEALNWIQQLSKEQRSKPEVLRRLPILKGVAREAWFSPYYPVEGLPPNSFQRHQLQATEVKGPIESEFAKARLEQMADYPSHYSPERIRLQDQWIRRLLKRVEVASEPRPRVAFMAGPMGSGKTTSLQYLDQWGWIRREQFLTLDPDEIRKWIPEYAEWQQSEFSDFAALLTQHEAMEVVDITLRVALERGFNVVVSTSFRDRPHYQRTLMRIRRQQPHYQVELIKIETTPERLLRINDDVDSREGRLTPVELALRSMIEVEESVQSLMNQFDQILTINNRGPFPVIESLRDLAAEKRNQAADCSATWSKRL